MRPCRHYQHGIPRPSEGRPRSGGPSPGWSWDLPILRGQVPRLSGAAAVRRRDQAAAGVGGTGTVRQVGRRRGPTGSARPLQSASRCAPMAVLGAVRPPRRAGVPTAPERLGPPASRNPGRQAGASGHLEPAHLRLGRHDQGRPRPPPARLQARNLLPLAQRVRSARPRADGGVRSMAGLRPGCRLAQARAARLAA
jgi:hypothetical protein